VSAPRGTQTPTSYNIASLVLRCYQLHHWSILCFNYLPDAKLDMYLRRESNPYGHFCPQDFLTTMVFTTLSVCSLDYIFTISYDLGAPCLVSTRSFSGFARYCHFTGFTEFTEFYLDDFSFSTQINLSLACLPIPPPRHYVKRTLQRYDYFSNNHILE
jgi:hypothetical protein